MVLQKVSTEAWRWACGKCGKQGISIYRATAEANKDAHMITHRKDRTLRKAKKRGAGHG